MNSTSTPNEPTLYPSAYMVLNNKGYTKHYYAGTERVAARLGGGGLDALQPVIASDDELQWKADKLFKQSLDHVNHRVLGENDLDCIMNNEFAREEFGRWIDGIPYHVRADVETEYWQFKEMVNSMLDDPNNGHEKEVYFYHSDHLGSASWITDFEGMAVQHLQYLPYGEPYVNQHPFGYSERFTFTGKEKDEETGYGYFGARYMDHELMTMWLSVDPMADKYPSISPYAYCAWNPIRLIDPDGREMNPVYNYKGILLGCTNEGFTGKIIIYDGENTSFEGMSSDDFVSANYSAEYYDMDNECRLDNVAKESMYRNILSNYDGTDINGYTFYQQDITFNFDKEKSGNYSVNPYLDHFLLNVSEKYLTYQDVIYDGQDAILFRGGHYDASVENIAASIIYHEWYGHYCNKWTEKGGTHYKCYEAVRDCPFFQKCTPEYRDDVLQQIINMK